MIRAPRQFVCDLAESAAPPEAEAASILETDLADNLDDLTLAYVLKARDCFDSLRQAAAQLGGLLLLASTGGSSQILDLPMLELAAAAQREAEAALREASIPAPALHHHFHLSRASDRIGEALRIALQGSIRFDESALDRTFQTLQAGWQDMLSATRTLPGFQVVDFSQACCAAHMQGQSNFRVGFEGRVERKAGGI
jgi:hypothetical protein